MINYRPLHEMEGWNFLNISELRFQDEETKWMMVNVCMGYITPDEPSRVLQCTIIDNLNAKCN